MARLINLFSFSGKVGDYVGFIRNGKSYVRRKPVKIKAEPTPAQIAQRQRFTFVQAFLKDIGKFLNSLPQVGRSETHLNLAVRQILREALLEEDGILKINYPEVILIRGRHIKVHGAVERDGDVLRLNWSVNTLANFNDGTAIILIYDAGLHEWQYHEVPYLRDSGSADLPLQEYTEGKPVHVYLILVAAVGRKASRSRYLGKV